MTEGPTLLKAGTDVAIHLPGRTFPARVSKVLRNGKEVESVEWVGSSGKSYELVLTTGAIVKPGDTTPGDHACWYCDTRLKEGPIGTFTCDCEGWKNDQ